MTQTLEYLSAGSVACPSCGFLAAWLGDHGASIEVHGKCLACLLAEYPDPFTSPEMEAEADAKVAAVIALREDRERRTGRRVFPCVQHMEPSCKFCGGRGWILGYPPGVLPP